MGEEITIITENGKKCASIFVLDNSVFFVDCVITIRRTSKSTQKTLLDEYMAPDTITMTRIKSTSEEDSQLEISSCGKTYRIQCKDWEIDEIEKAIISIKEAQQANFYTFTCEEMPNVIKSTNLSISLINPKPIKEWTAEGLGDLAVGCDEYLEVITGGSRMRVMTGKCSAVIYDPKMSNLFFRHKKAIYTFYVETGQAQGTFWSPRKLVGGTSVSFIKDNEKEDDSIFLATKRIGYLGSEELTIFKLQQDANGICTKSTYRRMYIAGFLMDITFLGKNIVVASNDFELIDLTDLTTQELLDPVDKTISLYVDKLASRPLCMTKIEDNTYLVAFDDVGFYINNYGSRKKAHVLFLWLMKVKSAFVFKEYIVAIGETQVKIFTLNDGTMRGIFDIKDGRHLPHPDHILIYNDETIYRLTCS